jgi:hypothetical protein
MCDISATAVINVINVITEMGVSDEAKNVIPLKFLRKIKNKNCFPLVNSIRGHTVYSVAMILRN